MRNKAACLASAIRFAKENPERVAATKRRYAERHASRCVKARKEWKERNPHKHYRAIRNSHLKKNFGITFDEYERMLAAQGGVCAICKGHQDPKLAFRHLAVDHDHFTGKVRGLLCNRCNLYLIAFEEPVEWIESVLVYLGIPHGS